MTSPSSDRDGAPRLTGKLIQCVVPDDGTDKAVLKALRERLGVVCGHISSCRSVAMLGKVKTRWGKLPPSQVARLVQVIVPEEQADAVFELMFETAGFDRGALGIVMQGPITGLTPFSLPQDVPDEVE